ncbi:MAG: hypothetical protein B6I20_02360 [Bacteroidetes bacterium 4572_117]|nr:MAG: hypothetical protein B6I20_02360 [Bacteroidetes bacterium 4572_117]
MGKICLFLISLIISISINGQEDNEEFLQGFLLGEYSVIGKMPENNDTYFGSMKIGFKNNKFEITRNINNSIVKASGKIKKTGPEQIKVFVINFTENKVLYEITYLIDTDFDNYGRLSGYRYYQNRETENPGLEALFITH